MKIGPLHFRDCMIFCMFAFGNTAFASQSDNEDSQKNKDSHKSEVYAQLSSSETQMSDLSTTKTIILENVDSLNGLEVNNNHKKVIVKESGLYFVMINGRLGSKIPSLIGNISLFLMKNGTPLSNSYINYANQNKKTATNLISQTLLPLNKGDTISVGISSTFPNLGLISEATTPQTPSITFSMYNI